MIPRDALSGRKPEGLPEGGVDLGVVDDGTGIPPAFISLEESRRRYTGTVLEITDHGELVVQLDSGGRRQFEPTTTTRTR